ncbi:hypothetical protein EDB82DRAFT_528273 [Fusarium venenatum]|uniref:uncharacterized protein n=1 Tax=Fusarium venenatum TaxID=56646 RepID=UPI001D659477|nr:hypothetical protein EDB82DRAFT_528273 [Fusarium venenatum]
MSPANELCSILQLSDLFAQRISLPPGRLLELQLCHHFLQMTQIATETQAAWSYWVLEQAAQSSGVMDALLGTSAFHLHRFSKFDTRLLMAAHEYMARAIEGHKKDLSGGLDELNTSKVVATCALIITHANSNAYPFSGDSDQRQPHDWFISFRRAMGILNKASPLIQDTVVGQELRTLHPIIRQDIHPNPFSFLLYYNPPSKSCNQEEISVCTTAVAHLSYIYVGLITEKPLRFSICVSDSFVALVTAKVPRALAICGYFFMVVKLGRQLWWIDGAPEREFDNIMRYLPRNWWSVMDWAIRIFEWNDRSTAP